MLHPSSSLFRVYHSCGAGTARGPAFKHLEDAKRYVFEQRTPGSFAIRRPDGHWHRWGESDSPVFTIAPRFARGTQVGEEAMHASTGTPAKTAPKGYPPGVPFVNFRKQSE